jgi:hypothetical protein
MTGVVCRGIGGAGRIVQNLDGDFFDHWFNSIILPCTCRREGKKVAIGDNLSSHFTSAALQQCEAHKMAIVCLPPNASI